MGTSYEIFYYYYYIFVIIVIVNTTTIIITIITTIITIITVSLIVNINWFSNLCTLQNKKRIPSEVFSGIFLIMDFGTTFSPEHEF